MTTQPPAPAPYVPTDVYVRVQHFYARQMHLLDGARPDPVAWSRTFTEDAEFGADFQEAPDIGRPAILESVRQGLQHIHAGGPVDFRHWFGMIDVHEDADATLRTRYYALALSTPKGGRLRIRGHLLCRDRLVHHGGGLLVSHRHLSAPPAGPAGPR